MQEIVSTGIAGGEVAVARPHPVAAAARRLVDRLSFLPPPPSSGPVVYSPVLLAYVAALWAGAAALAVFTVTRPTDLVTLVLGSVATGVMARYSVRTVASINLSWTPTIFIHLGLTFTLGPVGALAGAVTEGLGALVRLRNGWFRTSFNLANNYLSNMAAWAAFFAVRNEFGGPRSTAAAAVGGLVAGFCHYAVNHGCLKVVLVLVGAPSPRARALLRSPALLYSLGYGWAAFGFAILYQRAGVFGFSALLTPVILVQIALVLLARHSHANEEQRAAHEREREGLLTQIQGQNITLLEQTTALELQTELLEVRGAQLSHAYDGTLIAMTRALDARDSETEGHSRRVVEYTQLIALTLGVEGDQLRLITDGALLHDIGKLGVPDAILHKPGPLTEDEWKIMRRHPDMGALMVEPVEYLAEARRMISHHHERWDGRGYPRGLRGDQIDIGARIFSISDAVDAITQDRVYRLARTMDEAREEVLRCRAAQFAPDAVDAFLALPLEQLLAIQALRAPASIDLLSGNQEDRARYLANLGLGKNAPAAMARSASRGHGKLVRFPARTA